MAKVTKITKAELISTLVAKFRDGHNSVFTPEDKEGIRQAIKSEIETFKDEYLHKFQFRNASYEIVDIKDVDPKIIDKLIDIAICEATDWSTLDNFTTEFHNSYRSFNDKYTLLLRYFSEPDAKSLFRSLPKDVLVTLNDTFDNIRNSFRNHLENILRDMVANVKKKVMAIEGIMVHVDDPFDPFIGKLNDSFSNKTFRAFTDPVTIRSAEELREERKILERRADEIRRFYDKNPGYFVD